MATEFKNLLVVLRDNLKGDYALENPAVARAILLARRFEASLHFFQTVHNASIVQNPLTSSPDSLLWQQDLLRAEERRIQELVQRVAHTSGLDTSGSAALDFPRSAAVMRRAQSLGADLILKESREESFVLGLLSNTDWELIRDAEVPVWLVSKNLEPASGIVAAVECQTGKDGDLQLDRKVFEVATALSKQFDAKLHLVHAFQVPAVDAYKGYMPLYPGEVFSPDTVATLEADAARERERVARRHGQSIHDFVKRYEIDLDDIIVVEGPTQQVIKVEAEHHQAGLIVMGASPDKGRWDRLLGRVTAEPALEDAPCDILFVH